MKKFLLLSLIIICSQAFAQKVAVIVNSPAQLQGERVYGGAAFGADLTTGQWTGDLAMAEPNIGCTKLTNPAAIAGKFCVIDRLTCNFDVKCLNAQDAGATACIVMNHNLSNAGGPPFRMASSSVGAQVTIPCVMLGYEDGIAIKAAMKLGTVNMTIGAFPKEANDLAMARTTCDGTFSQPLIRNPKYGSVPVNQIKQAGDMTFITGGTYTNIGTANQTNTRINCTITNGATEVFNSNSTSQNVAVDENATNTSGEFDYKNLATGTYTYTYTASSGNAEKFKLDNQISSTFNVTNSVLSKGRFNMASRTAVTSGAYLFGGGTAYRELMVPFSLKYGKGLQLDSLYTVLSTNTGTLADLYVEGRVYRWDDANTDGNIDTDEMTLVALGSQQFDPAETRTSAPITFVLENIEGTEPFYQIKEDGALYFASIQYAGGAHSVFFGYDNDYDQKMYFLEKDSAKTLTFEDYPYLTTNTQAGTGGPDMSAAGLFYFDCNGSGANEDETIYSPGSIAVNISKGLVATKDISNEAGISLNISPNPAKEDLYAFIHLNTKASVSYQIFNMNGTLVYNANEKHSGQEFNAKFNVSNLEEGQYILQVNTPKGFIKKSFIVVK